METKEVRDATAMTGDMNLSPKSDNEHYVEASRSDVIVTTSRWRMTYLNRLRDYEVVSTRTTSGYGFFGGIRYQKNWTLAPPSSQ